MQFLSRLDTFFFFFLLALTRPKQEGKGVKNKTQRRSRKTGISRYNFAQKEPGQ